MVLFVVQDVGLWVGLVNELSSIGHSAVVLDVGLVGVLVGLVGWLGCCGLDVCGLDVCGLVGRLFSIEQRQSVEKNYNCYNKHKKKYLVQCIFDFLFDNPIDCVAHKSNSIICHQP